jgi:DNA gyrase/topoisomerase IV subunit B
MSKSKKIEDTYKKLTQREHVLERPGMYIGSVKKQMEELWVAKESGDGIPKMEKTMVEYSPGFMKIFDEVLTNATDHSFRDVTVTTIKVEYSKETGEISVWNNGSGVPIQLHKEHNIYVPELIFGNLLSGSNYDDTNIRTGAGMNGLGSKLTNIYSSKFIVETIDSDEKKKFVQEFSNNMTERTKAKITSNSTKSYTKITFTPDYSRFDMEGLEDDTILLIRKRVLDCIACTNPTVQIYLNGEKLKGKGLIDYTKYFFEGEKVINEFHTERIKNKNGEVTEYIWEYAIVPYSHFEQVSFVNGNSTTQGGKHVDYILYQIINKLKKMLEDKKKLKELKPNFIKDKLFLFLRATVANPAFNSQTKEQLTTQSKDFGCNITVSDVFITKLYKSSITEEIVEFCKLKESASLAKVTDGKKTSRIFIPKLEDALWAGTNKSNQCTLILTEGESAKTFAMWGRSVVGPERYGVMSLKGKVLNLRDASMAQLMGNEEINNIKQIIGLKQDRIYKDTSELRYGKVMMLTDADCVSGDTPLLLKDTNNNILTDTIERLTDNFTKDTFSNKEFGNTNLEIWTEKGWTKINSIMRHKVSKTFYRVLTHTGIIDVSEDHPLLTNEGIEKTPKNCLIGDKLLHSFPTINENKVDIPNDLEKFNVKELWVYASKCKIPYYQSYKKIDLISELNIIKEEPIIDLNNINNINKNEAYVMGLFWADGTSGIYKWEYNYKPTNRPNDYTYNRTSYNWSISNNNINFLEKAKEILEQLYNLEFKIIECHTLRYNKSYRLIINGGLKTKDIVEKYTTLFYYKNECKYKNGNKYIPKEILNSTKQIREEFLIGYYNGDGYGHDINKQTELKFDVESKISAQCLFILCKSLNYEVSINILENKPNVISIILTKGHQQWDKNKIKKIINLGIIETYVYDLETENHHFQAGVGQMIVHNCDGSHIKSLLVNFFHYWWPDLLKINPDFLQTLKTPIVKAIKGKKIIEFFTEQDYLKWKETGNDIHNYHIRYFKGLGTSKKEDAKDTFKRLEELKVDYYYKNKTCDESILLAFEKDKNVKAPKIKKDKDSDDVSEDVSEDAVAIIKCSDKRKTWLSNYNKNLYIDVKENRVSYQDLINKELIHFSIYDNLRSIPSICDGLKPSQRKILYYMLKKKKTDLIKVAQLSGYVSAETGYHHGEMSLQGAIINMAQDFVGTNNINLLYPDGNFGSRYAAGKDSASPRYIYTRLSDVTETIFNTYDTPLLTFLNDDGSPIEPEWYLPIIPMVLVNGCEGIGTGYSTYIPTYNPTDIIVHLIKMINDENYIPTKLMPYFRGFHGKVEELEKGSYITKGAWEKLSDRQIKVTEIPVGMGVTTYKEFLESLIENNNIAKKNDKTSKAKKKKFELKDIQNKTKDENDDICFIIDFKSESDLSDLIKSGTLEKELKLVKSFSINNMYLFNENLILTKYDTPVDILLEFFDIRIQYYIKRRDYIIKKLKRELLILESKARFISEYIEGELDINKKSKDYIVSLLKERKYPTDEDSYDYLLRLPIYSLTLEKINELNKQCENKKRELQFIKNKTPEELWKIDLEELLKKLV